MILLLWADVPVSCLIRQHFDLFSLELTKCILNFLLSVFVSITYIIITIKNFIVEEFRKLNGCFVKDSLILIDTDDMRNASLDKNLANLLWVTACNIHELERCWCLEIRGLSWCGKGCSTIWITWCFIEESWSYSFLLSLELLKLIFYIWYHILKVTCKEKLWCTVLVLKDENVTLTFVLKPSFLISLVETFSILKSMAWKM